MGISDAISTSPVNTPVSKHSSVLSTRKVSIYATIQTSTASAKRKKGAPLAILMEVLIKEYRKSKWK
jgi:hypothetical protein